MHLRASRVYGRAKFDLLRLKRPQRSVKTRADIDVSCKASPAELLEYSTGLKVKKIERKRTGEVPEPFISPFIHCRNNNLPVKTQFECRSCSVHGRVFSASAGSAVPRVGGDFR